MSVIVALDYGVKKMGVAVGNSLIGTSQPLQIMPMQNGQPDWEILLKLLDTWQASTILVGLPLHIDGSESHLSKRATKFAKRLNHKLKERHTPKAVYMVDERLSSHAATLAVKANSASVNAKQPVDDMAAYILIESWLNEPQGVLLN